VPRSEGSNVPFGLASQNGDIVQQLHQAANAFVSERYGRGQGMDLDRRRAIVDALLRAVDSEPEDAGTPLENAAANLGCSVKELGTLIRERGHPPTWQYMVADAMTRLDGSADVPLDEQWRLKLRSSLERTSSELDRRCAYGRGSTWWSALMLERAVDALDEHLRARDPDRDEKIDATAWTGGLMANGLREVLLDALSALSAHTTTTKQRVATDLGRDDRGGAVNVGNAPSGRLPVAVRLARRGPPSVADGASGPERAAALLAYLARLAPRSRRTMLGAAENLARAYAGAGAEVFDWRRLDVASATALRAWCARQVERGAWAPATANLHVQCLRGFRRGWQTAH
jgi:hypothetical protein